MSIHKFSNCRKGEYIVATNIFSFYHFMAPILKNLLAPQSLVNHFCIDNRKSVSIINESLTAENLRILSYFLCKSKQSAALPTNSYH